MTDTDADIPAPSVMVVDDEEVILLMLEDFLQDIGYKVKVFQSAKKGLDYYITNWKEIDLVLIDMLMPEMNGKDLFAEMKNVNPDAKCMISSGFTMNKHVEAMMNDGVVNYIAKPYRLNKLEDLLKKFFDQK